MSIDQAVLGYLLDYLWHNQGSDLHLTAGAKPLVRIVDELQTVPGTQELDGVDTNALAEQLLNTAQLAELTAGHDVDFSMSWRGNARIRGNVFHQRDTVALALRMMPRRIPTFDELGLPPVVRRLGQLNQGFVLISGPTGSGKSTTLASLVDWINEHRAVNIITIEDPIEYVHTHKRSAVNQRAVGRDTESFVSALRSALREDPDILVIGEMRDLESISAALTLAETGHLVFTSVHTNDTSQALERLVNVFPGDKQQHVRIQLASSLTAVVHQQLLPRAGGGLVAAFEILIANPAVRHLLVEGKVSQVRNQLLSFQRDGMQTLEVSLSDLLSRGLITYEDAMAKSLHPKDIRRLDGPAAG